MKQDTPPLSPAAPGDDTAFFGHPRGLRTLFFTEMWERFSYYGMRAILILYMVGAPETGGLGFSDKQGGLVYGIYTGSVYVLSLLGGWIADRFTGQRKAVLWGGVGIMLGHVLLAVPSGSTFYLGLIVIALGTGILKPNISTIVGQLYPPEDERRDAGFTIYYMGINIGAGVAPYVIGFLAQSETFRGWLAGAGLNPENSWHFGFGAAAVGMFFGLVQYLLGERRLRDAGLRPTPPRDATEARRNRRLLVSFLVALGGVPALVVLLGASGLVEMTVDRVTYGTLAVLLLIATGFFVAMFTIAKWTPQERRRIIAILALFVAAIFFFSVFEQAGSTFNLFAERNTDNSIFGWTFPSSYWQGVNSAFILLLAPVFAALWTYLARRNRNPSWPVKFGLGLVLVAAGCLVMLPAAKTVMAGGKAGPGFLVALYLLHTCAELCLSPVGLSSTTRIAPRQIAGLAMGVWFMGTGIGNYLAGMYAGYTGALPLDRLFVTIAIPPLAAGVIFFALVRPLRRVSHD